MPSKKLGAPNRQRRCDALSIKLLARTISTDILDKSDAY